MTRRIADLDDFRQIVHEGQGVIVITDTAREAPTVHLPSCPFVKETYFEEKVVEGSEGSGAYYLAGDRDAAEAAFGASPCGHCFG